MIMYQVVWKKNLLNETKRGKLVNLYELIGKKKGVDNYERIQSILYEG